MEPSRLSSADIKRLEFDILCYFADFCDRNGLRYTLSWGTLLGAVRHHGFIPWDDDIDVDMPRPDYDALLYLLRQQPDDRYRVVDFTDTDGGFASPFAKLMDTHTQVEFTRARSSDGWGLWIDIFPVDGVPSDEAGRAACCRQYHRRAVPLSVTSFKTAPTAGTAKRWIREGLNVLLRALGQTPTRLSAAIDRLSRRYPFDYSDKVLSIAGGATPSQYLLTTDFDDRARVEFEGRTFYAPAQYHEFLQRLYGDYMTPPPEGERETHELVAYRTADDAAETKP